MSGEQKLEFAFAVPASDLVAMELALVRELGEGKRIAAARPGAGQSCGRVGGSESDEFRVWSCLRGND